MAVGQNPEPAHSQMRIFGQSEKTALRIEAATCGGGDVRWPSHIYIHVRVNGLTLFSLCLRLCFVVVFFLMRLTAS